MNRRIFIGLIAIAASCCYAPAIADTRKTKFRASVSNSCTLSIQNDGLLVTNASGRILDSGIPGGRPARVRATTTSRSFKVHTITPTAFTVGDSTNTAFVSSYSISGSTTVTNVPSIIQTSLNSGRHLVSVNLKALKMIGAPFPQGNYEAVVVVRCE